MTPPELLGDLAAVFLARTWHRQPEGAPPMNDPYTLENRLCDDTGLISDERVEPGARGTLFDPDLTYRQQLNNLRGRTGLGAYTGSPVACTGSAHLAREHIRCTNPIHVRMQTVERQATR